MKFEGVVLEEKNDFYEYGDSSSFFILTKDGTETGHYFIMRQGNKIYSLALGGINFDDPKDWEELVEPKLQLLSAYNLRESR